MAPASVAPTRFAAVAELERVLAERYPPFAPAVGQGVTLFGEKWLSELDATLVAVTRAAGSIEGAAKGYAAFALDVLRRQRIFEKERVYPAKTYEQAAREVYFDEAYMAGEYLPGLLVSHYLWPHHYRQLVFFDNAFVESMRIARATRFVEVGVGTGTYSCLILDRLPAATGVGYDISPSSLAYAEVQAAARGFADRYGVARRDVVAEPLRDCEWLVCVEVLEHLEQPEEFLAALRSGLSGRAFVTAAVNAPNADHIYLYRSVDEVIDQVTGCGFRLEQAFVGAAHPPRAPGLPVPTVVALIVS